ncbi:MAG: nucleotidyltransferase domain-containing protein [Candidatus Aureabacteria bacterium]|nr:nucleotidyltransferase domain-containing protein [Candidatus Auribacterota bacterium]
MKDIFSTKERIAILKAVIFKEEGISVNSIAKQLKLSKGLVSKYFSILLKENILRKSDNKLAVADSPSVKGIKILLNLEGIDYKAFKKYPFVISAGLYGSCAKGENTEESDVDLWVRVKEASEKELASLTAILRKKIRKVKPIILTDSKIEKLMKEDVLFYHSLAFGSIILYGDKNGVQL